MFLQTVSRPLQAGGESVVVSLISVFAGASLADNVRYSLDDPTCAANKNENFSPVPTAMGCPVIESGPAVRRIRPAAGCRRSAVPMGPVL
ncbi:MAG: hypothetical protein Ct9H300mP1_30360 [Planctomycetaceae bacterium]|nr:MAG: hypothetical protein Ct9H300mP1_30360 [Planctomycetaceae bacterium]